MSDDTEFPSPTAAGVISRPAAGRVADTVTRLLDVLHAKDITVFAVVDHSGEAAKVGRQLRDTKLIIFGNPAAGTGLMQSAPLIALDLPLKLLVWEGDDHQVFVSYNEPAYLAARYALDSDQVAVLAAVDALATLITEPERETR